MTLSVLDGEPLQPVVAAVYKATGRRPHKSCIYRWMQAGSRGVLFPFVMLGGQRMTSVQAVHRWIAAVTAIANGDVLKTQTAKQRERAIDRADRELAADGW